MKKKRLIESINHFFSASGKCTMKVYDELDMSQLTIKQIEHLKIINSCDALTFSKLAEITSLSKPTVTEMINKFIKMDCVYKKRSTEDARTYFIRLTERGTQIASAHETSVDILAQQIRENLSDDEIDILIQLIDKIRITESAK